MCSLTARAEDDELHEHALSALMLNGKGLASAVYGVFIGESVH